MIRCEHCGSVLPDGAIFCGECGRAVNTAANRRAAAPEPVDRGTPPPLQQPDQHGRRQDPATEAWLPESTLDPATRAWLTGEDRRRSGPVAPVPVQTPDSFAPRSAPTHVHGAGSGLGEWTGRPAEQTPAPVDRSADHQQHPAEPSLDPDAFPAEALAPDDDPEVTRVTRRPGTAAASRPSAVDRDDAPSSSATPPAAPFWTPAPEAVAPAPSAPSWWIGRAGDDTAAADPAESGPAGAPLAAPSSAPSAPSSAGDAPVDIAPADVEPDAVEPSAPGPEPVDQSPRPGDTAVVEPLVDRRAARPTPLIQPGTHPTTCHVCGHQLEPDDIFCNECGAVRPAVTAAFTGPVVPLPIARPDWAASSTADEVDAGSDEAEVDAASDEVEPDSEDTAADETGAEPSPADEQGHRAPDVDLTDESRTSTDTPLSAGSSIPPMPVTPSVPSSAPHADSAESAVPTAAPLPPIPGMTGPVLPASDEVTVPSSGDADEPAQLDDDEDVDATRIVTKTPTRAPFVLHCSTGEQLGVHGTGLLGRLPRPQPGERFDDLLTVHDPGKSVSKTHLELGRDGDDLWVSDRFSGNGSVIRHIDGSIRRCEPGRRYRVERGARVDIGEQFFLVQ